MHLIRFLAYQCLRLAVVVLGVAMLNFFLIHSAPGDPAMVLAGESGAADPQFLEQLRRQFGLDQPLYIQLLQYVSNIARFELGYSYRQNVPVLTLIADRLPATLFLAIPAFLISLGLGIYWGRSAAQRRGLRLALFTGGTAIFNSAPVFWLALVLIIVFSFWLGWFPAFGIRTPGEAQPFLVQLVDMAWHAVLPIVTMSLFYLAVYARLMRSSMLEVMDLDYVRTALAKGASRRRVVRRHVAPNAILPVVAMAGMQAGQLIGGSVVVETVFAWPGIGRLAFDALQQRDYPVLMGILLVSSVVVIVINVLTDLVVSYLDPRIEVAN